MAKRAERAEARKLRAQGLSLRQIARRLDVALSSASVWVRDIPLPEPPPPPPPPPPEPETEPPRLCSRCEQVLPASSFNRNGQGRQWWCRDCFRVYFRERGSLHLEQVKKSKARRKETAVALVDRYLSSHPCVDCGETDPVVLEFDHLRDKRAAVSVLRHEGTGTQELTQEIVKCEVVCVNCHRRRTASRGNWMRADPDWRGRIKRCRRVVERNLAFVYEALEEFPCIDCGEEDICVLEFDHIGPKRMPVVRLAMQGYGIKTVRHEVAQCEIRCGNCHRRRHHRLARAAA